MTTRDRIKSEIDRVSEERLNELFEVVKRFSLTREPPEEPSLMARLKQIKIEAPADFSTHLDLYISGEKRVE